MLPQLPAKLPPAITKGYDVAEFITCMDMAERHSPEKAPP
jgi:hypothetical protein